MQLIFARRMQRKTATDGRCRTRIITAGVVPSLHVYYKNTHLKQYYKEGRGLRTETTINNTYDFGVGRSLAHLPEIRAIGRAANRRVLEVERVSHDCHIGAEAFSPTSGTSISLARYQLSIAVSAPSRLHSSR